MAAEVQYYFLNRAGHSNYGQDDGWTFDDQIREYVSPQFAGLDNLLKVFSGMLIAVLGASEAGKTMFLLQLFLHQAKVNNRYYLIFSPESEMRENMRKLLAMAGNAKYKSFIIEHFEFIEPKNGVMEGEIMLRGIEEIIAERKDDAWPITDVLIDPMNSVFNDKGEMLGYNERIPLMVKFKEMAKKHKLTWWFTEHAKTRQKFKGRLNELTDPEDFVSGREIHNKVDAFLTLDRICRYEEKEVAGVISTDRHLTNVVKIQNMKTKDAKNYRNGVIYATYDVHKDRYQFGESVEYSELDKRYIMRGNPDTPLRIFD